MKAVGLLVVSSRNKLELLVLVIEFGCVFCEVGTEDVNTVR